MPADAAFERIHKGNRGIKVSTRNTSECKNQRNKCGTRGYRVCKKRESDITPCEPLAHNPGTDNSGYQEGRSDELRCSSSR